MSSKPYQLALISGGSEQGKQVGEVIADTCVDLTLDSATPEAILAHIEKMKLVPADLKAKTVLIVSGDVKSALLTWSALVGFSGRRLPVAVGNSLIDADKLWNVAAKLKGAKKPEEKAELVSVGKEVGDVPSVMLGGEDLFAGLDKAGIELIGFARQVHFTPNENLHTALIQLIALSGMRARGADDRLPMLVLGDEEPTSLDDLRKAGLELKKGLQAAMGLPVVPAKELTERQVKLNEAASRNIEEIMMLLGSHADEEMWHCPRPERHNNGDKNPSMRIVEGKVRCARCDKEWVDSLRLTVDSLGISPDEAADLLVGTDAAWQGLRPTFKYHD